MTAARGEATAGVLVYEPPAAVGVDDLEAVLTRAFEAVRAALERGEAVVVVLDERDVQGAGDPAAAALAHGLLGLARALALEGRKPGWRIAVLAAPRELDGDERQRWVAHLAASAAASGTLVRLGGEHLGRVPA
jgi:prolyl-tRNA editing enzyme YbaK/EbsC (Cys-tRNA(Pro) deacylase)